MVLHLPTRDSLPGLAGRLANWTESNPTVKVELQRRAPAFTGFTRRALQFGIATELVAVEGRGFGPGAALITLNRQVTDDVDTCFASAEKLGRWFGRTGSSATIFGLLGMEP
jgi:hypothetical protein